MLAEYYARYTDCGSIPLTQIADTRSHFGHLRILFEIDLETDDAWYGLESCAKAFGRAGLKPIALRMKGNGAITCKLADTPTADLFYLAETLFTETGIRLTGWTTIIEGDG